MPSLQISLSYTAIYARVSTDEQAEHGNIQTQLDYARKYCDLKEYHEVTFYEDDGITGTLPLEERPAGAQLMADAKDGKLKRVLVYKLDRLGRSPRVILNAIHDLEEYGIEVVSMSENFDTHSPAGRAFLGISSVFAGLERETILERLWLGANRAAQQGKWLGGIVPYGYYVDDDGFLAINNEPLDGHEGMSEADVIRLIYHLVADEGRSTIYVADYLNNIGIPPAYTRNGRQILRGKRKVNTQGIWRPARVRNTIVNTTYKGIHQYGKRSAKEREIITREVPAIVSVEMWARARQTLTNNILEATRNQKRRYLLRGLIKCAKCGHTYSGTAMRSRPGEVSPYYICGGKNRQLNGHAIALCDAKNVPAEWLDDLIWQECLRFLNDPDTALVQYWEEQNGREESTPRVPVLANEEQAIRQTLQSGVGERDRILDLYRRKYITMQDVERQLEKITREENTLRNRLQEIVKQQALETAEDDRRAAAIEVLQGLRGSLTETMSFDEKRRIVKALVKCIMVTTISDGPSGRWHKRATIQVDYQF
jgi:site-specific DNA recombinase